MARLHQGPEDDAALVGVHVVHQLLIQLQAVHGVALQVPEGGEAGAEVVEDHPHALGPDGLDILPQLLLLGGGHVLALGHLQDEELGGELVALDDLEAALGEVRGGPWFCGRSCRR